jgi:hypothetical protein
MEARRMRTKHNTNEALFPMQERATRFRCRYGLPATFAVSLVLACGASSNTHAPEFPNDGATSSLQDSSTNTSDVSQSTVDASIPVSDAECTATPTGTPPALAPGQWVNISPTGLFRPGQPVPPYGCMDIHVAPCSPNVLYLTTDVEGMWNSTDRGATWTQIGNLPNPISPGVMEIDPKDPLSMYYGGGVRGNSIGFWVSTNGGKTWSQPPGFTAQANNSVGGWVNDVYVVTPDPADFKHVLLTFHSGWEGKADAGVLESKDGGNTWVRHVPKGGWAAGHSVFFLGNSSTWLLGTQAAGFWRTVDSGGNWTQVSTQNMQHGAVRPFYSKSGALYVGGVNRILRSTDNGLSFTLVGPQTQDGYYAVIGDGNTLYTQPANTGGNTTGPQPYISSADNDGVTWSPYNSQTFGDGPYRMAFDDANGIVYSANWNSGVWALKVK